MFWSSAGRRGSVGLLRCWSLTAGPRTLTTPRCPLHTSRLFSISAPAQCPPHEEVNPPLKRWDLAVSPFSTVRAQLGGSSISIQPLDPHAFPEADRVFITVHGTDSGQEVGLDHLHVHYDDQSKELHISAERVNSRVSIDLTAPIKSNLFIATQGKGNVQVKKMECDVCKVQTEKGNCVLHSIRGHLVEVQSHGGHVTGVGTIHGNVDICTSGDSGVDVKKLQGTRMNVSTERGPLKVKAIYAESSCVSSCSGRVELGLVHETSGDDDFLKWSCIQGEHSRRQPLNKLQCKLMGHLSYSNSRLAQDFRTRLLLERDLSPRLARYRAPHILIELGLHPGNATVTNVSGDTVIDGSNSFLKVSSHSGGIDVHVGEGGSAELHSQEGAVCVRVPSSLKAGVELCGASVEISPEVVLHGEENNTTQGQTTVTGFINGESPVEKWVKAQAHRNSVRLKTQSWFESLKLGS